MATVRVVDPSEPAAIDAIASPLGQRFDRPVTLDISSLPVVRSEG